MFIPITPVPKPRLTQRDRWKHRPGVDRYHAFCDELRLKYHHPLPSSLVVSFYIAMPPSWSQKKKLLHDGQPHQQRPDIDNLCKAVMDALAEDDSHVYCLWAQKRWARVAGININQQ